MQSKQELFKGVADKEDPGIDNFVGKNNNNQKASFIQENYETKIL